MLTLEWNGEEPGSTAAAFFISVISMVKNVDPFSDPEHRADFIAVKRTVRVPDVFLQYLNGVDVGPAYLARRLGRLPFRDMRFSDR